MRTRKKFFYLIISLWGISTHLLSQTAAADPVIKAMNEAIQDEYRSYATYQKVIADFGRIRPFINIVRAEARHVGEISALFEARGLRTPKSRWTSRNVPSYETIKAACQAGVRSELKNIAIYRRLMKLELPRDVEETFSYLRAASSENHLPAFRRCVERE